LRRCVARLETKRPASPEILATDLDIQDIITLNLTRAVQICVDIATHIIAHTEAEPPNTMAGAFDTLSNLGTLEPALAQRMKNAVGFRNIAVHTYQAIDWQIVYSICKDHLDDFRDFARAIARTF